MKIDVVELQQDDVILTMINVGTLPPEEVDDFIKTQIQDLEDILDCKVVVIPTRTGNTMEQVTVFRKSKSKKDFGYED